ncbi:SulP family inorganic anion transporter [Shouchella patagoniensis]|uniref:SulP family inorganic anion transporter n=1 Tax=Shouchella patagoniensis TaxID=228576 RepID=UPI000995D19A|nr:SulP family inorganic anion transporter [Shouchella patagoniensis]
MEESLKQQWFGNVRGDILAGIVVALALIPEAIAFSIIAGVDPMVGLYASFCIAIVISFVGGRPGMISAATGAMALVMVTLVANHGLEYLLAATIVTGFLQIVFGVLKLAQFMKFVPRTVMTGFVNSLAILIFIAQLEHFIGETWVMYALVALTLAIIYLLPYVTKAIPSTLVAIIVVTAIVLILNIDVRNVGDMGALTQTLPAFALPNVPFNLETLAIVFPYALALAIVGLLESLLTATIVDDLTDTSSNKNRESRGQGIANVVTGLFGGMAGCAMIGQSVINVKSGGRGRLSALVAGVFLMFLIIVLGNIVVQIPMAALAGVMMMVSISTFDWKSVTTLHKLPRTDAAVLIATVFTVVMTGNLAYGVLGGVLLSMVFFAAKLSKVQVESKLDQTGNTRYYRVEGPLFFASVTDFLAKIDVYEHVHAVVVDLSHSHIWDDSAVGALDRIEAKFTARKVKLTFKGVDQESKTLLKSIGTISSNSSH